jgi:hypothetical protein
MEVMVKGLLDFGRPLASHFFKQVFVIALFSR